MKIILLEDWMLHEQFFENKVFFFQVQILLFTHNASRDPFLSERNLCISEYNEPLTGIRTRFAYFSTRTTNHCTTCISVITSGVLRDVQNKEFHWECNNWWWLEKIQELFGGDENIIEKEAVERRSRLHSEERRFEWWVYRKSKKKMFVLILWEFPVEVFVFKMI